MLSIGGWESGNFSEMSASAQHRRKFAAVCRQIVQTYNIDGIDIDWEYPTSSDAGISSDPDDTKNYTLMMRDIREAIGKKKLLTLASVSNARYIDFKQILPYVDFVNIMAYDMGNAPLHQAALYRSGNSGWMTADEAVQAHLAAGVPADKLVLGVPFYGRGGTEYPTTNYGEINFNEPYHEVWDDTAKVPYLANQSGKLVLGYDNPRSLAIKCQYIKDMNLKGIMYWEYNGDNKQGDLRQTLAEKLLKKTSSH